MKRFFLLSFITVLLAFTFQSCKNTPDDQTKPEGQLEFAFSVNQLKSALKSTTDSGYVQGITNVVVTIEDLQGNVVKNSEKVEIYNMNGYYISKPISLVAGGYKLSRFFVLDAKNNVVYASPMKGSTKAYLVQNPLAISFTAQKDVVTKLTPEVISSADSRPEDFGYVTFSFDISKTFDFLVGAFVYNSSSMNYEITTASISIYSDTIKVFAGQLGSTRTDSVVYPTKYDTLGITNKITLPERYTTFTVTISKLGYKSYSKIFTKEELRLQYRKEDKWPLVVILEKSSLLDGLIAYYKFNGNVLDYSGNNNNGTFLGRGLFTYGKNLADSTSALNLNGSSDYVIVKNSASLNPKQITVSAWYYTVPFYGDGANALVEKISTDSPFYQYNLAVTGNLYVGSTGGTDWRKFAFYISTTNGKYYIWSGDANSTFVKYNLYTWYHIAGTYDGTTIKLYVNGELTSHLDVRGDLMNYSTDINIGRNPLLYDRPDYDYTAGKIDEVRIYNRALNQAEINTLYQQ